MAPDEGLKIQTIHLNTQELGTFDITIKPGKHIRVRFDSSNYADISITSNGDIEIHNLVGFNPQIIDRRDKNTVLSQIQNRDRISQDLKDHPLPPSPLCMTKIDLKKKNQKVQYTSIFIPDKDKKDKI